MGDAMHTSDMDSTKINGNINDDVPVKSTRIRVGRSIAGFGLSPGITKEQRLEMEGLMKTAFGKLEDSYKDFAEVFDPIIQEYHGISADSTHTTSFLSLETR